MSTGNTPITSPVYVPSTVPTLNVPGLQTFLTSELRKIAVSISRLHDLEPLLTGVEPTKPQEAWIRYAVAPWNPLGVSSGNSGWVQFTGGTWSKFPT